jgi:hypothetical protein
MPTRDDLAVVNAAGNGSASKRRIGWSLAIYALALAVAAPSTLAKHTQEPERIAIGALDWDAVTQQFDIEVEASFGTGVSGDAAEFELVAEVIVYQKVDGNRTFSVDDRLVWIIDVPDADQADVPRNQLVPLHTFDLPRPEGFADLVDVEVYLQLLGPSGQTIHSTRVEVEDIDIGPPVSL